jgi:hypothetical protein
MDPTVDRAVARQHLELVNKHVAEGHRRVEAQRALVARLQRDGHDVQQGIALLREFEKTLALQVETRDRIAKN